MGLSSECCDGAAAASVLWLPLRAYTFLITLGSSQSDSTSPLADVTLLLLLVLINHSPHPAQTPQSSAQHGVQNGAQNPYLAALQALQDTTDAGDSGDAESGLGQVAPGTAAVSYAHLYNALGANLHQEAAVLLLYALIHKCHRFQQYVLVRSDADVLLTPILQRWCLHV